MPDSALQTSRTPRLGAVHKATDNRRYMPAMLDMLADAAGDEDTCGADDDAPALGPEVGTALACAVPAAAMFSTSTVPSFSQVT